MRTGDLVTGRIMLKRLTRNNEKMAEVDTIDIKGFIMLNAGFIQGGFYGMLCPAAFLILINSQAPKKENYA